MRHIAIVGSGPAGYYTAEALLKALGDEVRVDIIDRLPVPYGLIRSGVAPDHQSIKAVARRYEAVHASEAVRFVGNVTLGRDISIAELQSHYDAVVLATGAPDDRAIDIPGADLPGVVGSAAFVGWYNGHPDHSHIEPALAGPGAVVIGNGNVALDVTRILAKTQSELGASDIAAHALAAFDTAGITQISVLGRRGPHQIAMTPKELGELGHLARAQPQVDPADLPPAADDLALEPGMRKSVAHLRAFAVAAPASKALTIDFDFFAMPIAIEGNGKVERIIVERTRLDADMKPVATGDTYAIPASLVVACIGYRTPMIDGVAHDDRSGRFVNEDGRIGPGLYCVGWAKRGPSGTIGTNRPDAYAVVDRLVADLANTSPMPGRAAIEDRLAARQVDVVAFEDWKKIDAAETIRARPGAPREKFVSIADMLRARQ